jgi:hypothetical protein
VQMTGDRLDDLVAGLLKVNDEDLASTVREPEAQALFARIVAAPTGRAKAPPPADRRRPGGRWLIAAAGLAAAAATAVVISLGGGPSPEVVTPAAAALRQAADSAREQDGIPRGRYLYVRSANASMALDCCEALVPHVRELWLGEHAGEALLRERPVGDPEFLSEQGRERWIDLGRPELEAKTPFSGILTGIPPRAWYEGRLELPSDADAIYERFEQDAEADTREPGVPFDAHVRSAMFHHFSDVLREARATPEQRAAAYEALARVPGLTLVGDVTDRLGRPGVAVALDVVDNEPSDFHYRYLLVFDPKTADLLEERREVLPGNRYRGLAAGMTEAYATYEYAVVEALGERPKRRVTA